MTRCATRLALAALLVISPLPDAASDEPAPRLAAGPMPGHSAMRTATVWLQLTAAAEVRIDYWPEGRPGEIASSRTAAATAQEQYAVHIELTGLEPGTRYAYRVIVDGRALAADDALYFRTQPLWQWRGDPPTFRLLAGSCTFVNEAAHDRPGRPYGDRYDIFSTMAARSPDMMLWLGDNVYLREADYASRWGMEYEENGHLVCHHAMLAAHSLGLGTTIIGLIPPIVNRSKALRNRYGIPKDNRVLTSLILGYPKYRYRQSIRRDLAGVRRPGASAVAAATDG